LDVLWPDSYTFGVARLLVGQLDFTATKGGKAPETYVFRPLHDPVERPAENYAHTLVQRLRQSDLDAGHQEGASPSVKSQVRMTLSELLVSVHPPGSKPERSGA
jgi:hypothetical protein